MALILGTDTYITEADAALYFASYGPEGAAVTEANIRQATLAIDRLYGPRFAGEVASSTQTLQFPRYGSATIPVLVAQATAELALILNSGTDVYVQPEALLSEETVKIDVIQSTRKFAQSHRTDLFHKISMILSPLLISQSGIGSMEVVRG